MEAKYKFTALVLCALLAGHASAATATSNVAIALDVTQPVCTLTLDKTKLELPAAPMPTMLGSDYLKFAKINVESSVGSGRVTSDSLTVGATVDCTQPADITSVSLGLGAGGAYLSNDSVFALVDGAAPPKKSPIGIFYEIEKINGNNMSHQFSGIANKLQPYVAGFKTAVVDGTKNQATIEFRLSLWANPGVPLGVPVGGQYKAATTFNVDY